MDEMSLMMDLLVLGTSGCAVLYCGQLARRLGRLRSAEAATPKALAELTAAIKASRDSAGAIARAAEEATSEMRAAYADMERRRQEAEDLSGILDGQAALAERRVQKAREAAEVALERVTKRASIELEALSAVVDIAMEARCADASDPRRAAKVPVTPAGQTGVGSVRQRPAREPNPFLRAAG